jgi:hypothetical protein
MKQEILNVLRRFINVCAGMLFIMVILGPVFEIVDGINNVQFAVLIICAAAAALSSLVFISKQELHGAAWWCREIICILINMAITLPLTFYAGLWKSLVGMLVVMLIILVIAFGNHFVEFLYDMKTANLINSKIKEMR